MITVILYSVPVISCIIHIGISLGHRFTVKKQNKKDVTLKTVVSMLCTH